MILRAAHWLSHCRLRSRKPGMAALARGAVGPQPLRALRSARLRPVRPACRRPVGRRLARRPRGRGRVDRGAALRPPRPVAGRRAWRIAFALRHPERVSHLVLVNAYGRGARARAADRRRAAGGRDAGQLRSASAGGATIRPSASSSPTCSFPTARRSSIAGGAIWSGRRRRAEVAAQLLVADAGHRRHATWRAGSRVPTLVMHCRGDMRVPFDEGASWPPRSRMRASCRWKARTTCCCPTSRPGPCSRPSSRRFLGQDRPEQPRAVREAGLTPAEAAILGLVAEGLDNRAIAARLGKSEKTVRNQLSVIFGKLGVHSRSQAIVKSLSPERRIRSGRRDICPGEAAGFRSAGGTAASCRQATGPSFSNASDRRRAFRGTGARPT